METKQVLNNDFIMMIRASPAMEQEQNYRCSLEKNLLQQWSNPSSKRITSEQLPSIFGQILLETVH